MPVNYTNRKGQTYSLCQGMTKTGKPRYFFAREPKGEPVSALPVGYHIEESVNGVVWLVRDRPQVIAAAELAAVEAAVQRHPQRGNYQIRVKDHTIVIFEREGPDIAALQAVLGHLGPLPRSAVEYLEQAGRYIPILRFILFDHEQRLFGAQRWHFSGSIDNWIYLSHSGQIAELARQLVPRLGTDAYFELD
ncbi:MAG: hypothetical protein IT317_06105 [Anaerolineales bacterium]|nr:hypothetical protein [Anaerolineales bacterium]